jgi:hypothetical protein
MWMKRIKKVILKLFFIVMLVFLAVGLVDANAIFNLRKYPIPEGTEPLNVVFSPPENFTTFDVNNVTFCFNMSIPKISGVSEVSIDYQYNASWLPNIGYDRLPKLAYPFGNEARNLTFTNIPIGSHSLSITVRAQYIINYSNPMTINYYELDSNSSVNFSIIPKAEKIEYAYLVIPAIIMLSVTAIILFYTNKHRKNRWFSQETLTSLSQETLTKKLLLKTIFRANYG